VVIAIYLLRWARIRDRSRSTAKALAWLDTIQQFTRELERRDQVWVDAWLARRPLPGNQEGFRIAQLTRLLKRIIERQAF